jgi:hypothetical protein
MVRHVKVEDAVYGVIGEHRAIVTGIPDEQRGEPLVALYTRPDMTAFRRVATQAPICHGCG